MYLGRKVAIRSWLVGVGGGIVTVALAGVPAVQAAQGTAASGGGATTVSGGGSLLIGGATRLVNKISAIVEQVVRHRVADRKYLAGQMRKERLERKLQERLELGEEKQESERRRRLQRRHREAAKAKKRYRARQKKKRVFQLDFR